MPPPDPLSGPELVAALAPLIGELVAMRGELEAIRVRIGALAPTGGGTPVPKPRPFTIGRL